MKYTRIGEKPNKTRLVLQKVSNIELIAPYIVEFVGTFLFVLCIGLNGIFFIFIFILILKKH